MNQKQISFQTCVQALEYVIKEIELGIEQLNPNCQHLFIVINTNEESVNFNHLYRQHPKQYLASLNGIIQFYNPPNVVNVKQDLIRHYLFNHIARKHPNVQIQMIFMVNFDHIRNLKEILQDDFGKIPNSQGLIIFLYNASTTNLSENQKLLEQQILIDEKSHYDNVDLFLQEVYNYGRIIPLSKQDIQDEQSITNILFTIPQGYTTKELENFFSVDPDCSSLLRQFQQVFQEVSDSKIQIVVEDIIEISSKSSTQQLLEMLPELIEFEITLRTLHIGINYNESLNQAIDKVYSCFAIKKPIRKNQDDFQKYLQIIGFLSVEEISNLLQVQFQQPLFMEKYIKILSTKIHSYELGLDLQKQQLLVTIQQLKQQCENQQERIQQQQFPGYQQYQQPPNSSCFSQYPQSLPQQNNQYCNLQQIEQPKSLQPPQYNQQNMKTQYSPQIEQPIPQQPLLNNQYQYTPQTEQPQQPQIIFQKEGKPKIDFCNYQQPQIRNQQLDDDDLKNLNQQQQQYQQSSQQRYSSPLNDEATAESSQRPGQNYSKQCQNQSRTQQMNRYGECDQEDRMRKKVKEN